MRGRIGGVTKMQFKSTFDQKQNLKDDPSLAVYQKQNKMQNSSECIKESKKSKVKLENYKCQTHFVRLQLMLWQRWMDEVDVQRQSSRSMMHRSEVELLLSP